MKNICKIGLALMLPLMIAGCKKDSTTKPIMIKSDPPVGPVVKAPANFRVVGYMISGEVENGQVNSFNLSRVNYLNIAFDTPGPDGKFPDIANLDATIISAHKYNTKVIASIGNGTDLSKITAANRADFISSMVASLDELQMDGIDVDFEGTNINKDYEDFIADLSAALKAKGKLLTAAVATWEADRFTDKSLTYFDFLNVMSYDNTGPWDKSDPGPHSPYSMAVADLDYWGNTRGIDKDRMNVGLPFYGYGFGAGVKVNYTYAQILKQYPGAENTDEITVKQGGTIYYNGIPTIQKKCKMALGSAGGVMIWELMQDATNDKSLLTAIDQALNGN